MNSQLTEKDPDAGKDWRQKQKREAEDEMVGRHYQFAGHEFGRALGDGEGQGGLMCCNPWGCKESNMTWRLNNNSPVTHSMLPSIRLTLVIHWFVV